MKPVLVAPGVERPGSSPRAIRHLIDAALAATLAFGLVAGSLAAAARPVAASTTSHAAVAAVDAAVTVDPGINPLVPQARPLNHVVYGYLPYWRLDANTAGRLQYDLISTIAFFGLGISSTGTIGMTAAGAKAYMSDDAITVTNAAHAAGVRVVPTFQLFDSGTLKKMTAFLGSTAAQNRFISAALDLMVRRSADGASLDFEPMHSAQTPAFLAFVERFGTAMRARIHGSQLVVATSAGAPFGLISGLAPIVDQMFVMTYNYHWSGSPVAGPLAPLDNASRTVVNHITRFLTRAAAAKIILGIGYYGYDWPVTSPDPNATVQSNVGAHGGVWSVSYGSVTAWLADHPEVVLHEDTVQGSGWFTYWDDASNSDREVYFEDAQSIAAKDDYAIATGLAGVGIWTLNNDRNYPDLWDVLRSKFYAPTHAAVVKITTGKVKVVHGKVTVVLRESITNLGSVPEKGTLNWGIRDNHDAGHVHGGKTVVVYPGRTLVVRTTVTIGWARALPAGTYKAFVTFKSASLRISGIPFRFHQAY